MKTHDIHTFTSTLHANLEAQLRELTAHPQDWMHISRALHAATTALQALRKFVLHYRFRDQAEEIHFFKDLKPPLAAQYLFRKKLVQLKTDMPVGDPEAITAFYRHTLLRLQQQPKTHATFMLYYGSGQTDQDAVYFIRNNNPADPLADTQFTTGYDMILAQWLADELLTAHIRTILHTAGTNKTLTWTAPKVALIELLYALHATQVFNQGKVDVRQVADALESTFNINLGNYYRTLLEIRLRKNNRTTFLDQLKEKFIHRLDDIK